VKDSLLFILILSICFTSDTNITLACSCQPLHYDKSFKKQIKLARREAKAVFSGKVIELTPDPRKFTLIVKFKVASYWKGGGGDEVTVSTPLAPTICGFSFEKDESYLVYAYRLKEAALGTDICQRTRVLEGAEEEVKILGALSKIGSE
jgi:hypothetical protein